MYPDYPNWARDSVAGKGWRNGKTWEQKGEYQILFMKRQGLLPSHRMLDVGCGVLRGGVHFIKYLDEKMYFGFDKEPEFIRISREEEVPRAGLEAKKPRLFADDNFDFGKLGLKFDMGFCMSVFTHIVPEQVETCLQNVKSSFVPGAKFFATFHIAPDGKVDRSTPLESHTDLPHISWRKNERMSVKYPPRRLIKIAERVGLEPKFIGPWEEPNSRKGVHSMMEFTVP